MTIYRISLCLLGIAAYSWANPAFGQFGGGRKNDAAVERPKTEIKIFHLQHLKANEAVGLISELFPGESSRFAADTRTNNLIATGDNETLTRVEAILLRLDEEPEPKKKQSAVRAIKLKRVHPKVAQAMLSQMGIELRAYADERTNTLFVDADAKSIEQVLQLVEILDAPDPGAEAAPPPATDFSIRIVWLLEGHQEGTSPIPEDLRESADALRKTMGLDELRTAAQMVVRADSVEGGQFDSTGTLKLDKEKLVSLHCRGSIFQAGRKESTVRMDIFASDGKSQICKLETTCRALTQGKPIILGSTPIESQASVFVIQLLKQ